MSITYCTVQRVYPLFAACFLMYMPQPIGTDWGFNLEFNLSPILILPKLLPLLDASKQHPSKLLLRRMTSR